MDAYDLWWTWPWAATQDFWRRALDLKDGHGPAATAEPPPWRMPNRTVTTFGELRLINFSTPGAAGAPTAVVAPFSLHDSMLVDLAPNHSLIETLIANGCSPLFLVDWASATPATRLNDIDAQLAALNVAVDDMTPPVNLVGLCQGGWLSLAYAARFPHKVRRLALVGAPIDIAAEPSPLTRAAEQTPLAAIDDLIGLGGGVVRGDHVAALWPHEFDEGREAVASLQLSNDGTEAERQVIERFEAWDRRRLDLPAPYYRQVFEWLYHENRLARGAFEALGRRIELSRLTCPLYLLAGAKDNIAPSGQVFAAATLTGAAHVSRAIAPCGHLALFIGRRTLAEEWPRIAAWLKAAELLSEQAPFAAGVTPRATERRESRARPRPAR
jgi:poly(3-hydroxyalkanoate) synthetase